MTTYMHCRPCPGSDIPTCSCSLFFFHSNYYVTSQYPTFTAPIYHHDRTSSPPEIPGRRRRLEDPIIMHASNYYATLPHQMSQSITQSSPSPPTPPPLPSPRRIYQQSNRKDEYCDLFNLLDRPPSPIRSRRKHVNSHANSRRHHRPIDIKNVQIKQVKDANDRKSNHHRQLSSCQTKEHSNDILLSKDKTKQTNEICQRRTTNKGFFRRVMHNYFCMPSPSSNNGYSS